MDNREQNNWVDCGTSGQKNKRKRLILCNIDKLGIYHKPNTQRRQVRIDDNS